MTNKRVKIGSLVKIVGPVPTRWEGRIGLLYEIETNEPEDPGPWSVCSVLFGEDRRVGFYYRELELYEDRKV